MSENLQPKSAPLRTDKRYEVTKTGLIGIQRDSMLQNELHYLVRIFKLIFISF